MLRRTILDKLVLRLAVGCAHLARLRAVAMFRFTIRDVLWLTAIVALGTGWWISSKRSQIQMVTHRAEIKELRLASETLMAERQAMRQEIWALRHPASSPQR